MSPITTVLATLALAAIPFTTATKMTTWSGTSCNSGDVVNWSGHSEQCESLGS